MRLARGATGFWGGRDVPLAPADRASFRSACFEAAREIGARVDELSFAGVSSFHAVTIAGRGASLVVLCHDHLPVVAFTGTPPVPGRPVARFVDPPAWAGCFGTVGYRVLHARDLSAPMTEVDLSELAMAELAQVRHWRPEAVGDLLFNWWD